MTLPHPRAVSLLAGILAPLLACSAARAQIHDEKPTPGLEEGLVFRMAGPRQAFIVPGREEHEPPFGSSSIAPTGDFTICLWVPAIGTRLANDSLSSPDWSVNTGEAVSATLQNPSLKDAIVMSAPFDSKKDGPHHIAVVVRRDARQPLSGLWIDGVERVSVAVPPVNLQVPGHPIRFDCESDSDRRPADVRIYNRALTRPEILEVYLRGSRRKEAQTSGPSATSGTQKSATPHVGSYPPKPKHPAPPPNGPRFIPQPGETIALIGGTEAVALAESGELEALLLMAFPQTRFHFRSLAWEGDTVFKQDRPMNFGSLEQQLRRVNAGAAFVMFGRQECLDAGSAAILGGEAGKLAGRDAGAPRADAGRSLAEFKAAFGELLDTVAKVTPNIVVIGPPPFEKKEPPLPDLSGRNEDLRAFSDVMRATARRHEAVFSNLAGSEAMREILENQKWTLDGIQMNDAGRFASAVVALADLHTATTARQSDDFFRPNSDVSMLAEALRSKNRLWHDYWRPSNWAFLHGDRTNQPSSRDPVNPQIRFFPAEQEKYLPVIKEAEEKIYKLVEEAQKKLP